MPDRVDFNLFTTDNGAMDDLDYTVRVSRRARRVALKVTPHGAVEVVLPPGVNRAEIPAFVARHRDWIVETRDRFHAASRLAPELNGPRPPRIDLPAVGETWRVEYDATAGRASTRKHERYLRLPDGEVERVHAALRRWLRGRAADHFEPWLRQLAVEHGYSINKIAIRAQRSRWGSCSSRGNINLNVNLLFLAPEVVRYLFVHELCHTVHLNHSPQYWALVARAEPRWKELDRRLRDAFRDVPLWAYP